MATRPKQPHVVVTKKRDVRTYAELWHASKCTLDIGLERPEASSWQFLASAVLTAFTFEAYLNHLGPSLFAHWSHLDRLSPWAKMELVCEKLQVSFPKGPGARPLQTVTRLFEFRNTIAHGRTHQLESKPVTRTVGNYSSELGERLLSDWEKLVSNETFAVRARADVEAVLKAIHKARPEPKEALFAFGVGHQRASLILDP
jgi:hypothetical protein